eukprot:2303133-Prymnesium_polylepis.2
MECGAKMRFDTPHTPTPCTSHTPGALPSMCATDGGCAAHHSPHAARAARGTLRGRRRRVASKTAWPPLWSTRACRICTAPPRPGLSFGRRWPRA